MVKPAPIKPCERSASWYSLLRSMKTFYWFDSIWFAARSPPPRQPTRTPCALSPPIARSGLLRIETARSLDPALVVNPAPLPVPSGPSSRCGGVDGGIGISTEPSALASRFAAGLGGGWGVSAVAAGEKERGPSKRGAIGGEDASETSCRAEPLAGPGACMLRDSAFCLFCLRHARNDSGSLLPLPVPTSSNPHRTRHIGN
eukprot:1344105-Pyramimonas_sp.AAC.2